MTHDLQQLAPEEADVVATLLIADAPVYDVALHCAISIIDAIAILERPHVKAHLKAAREAARTRLDTRAADLAPAALSTLHEIAHTTEIPAESDQQEWDAEPTTSRDRLAWQIERRRAATTVIRTATAYRRRPRRYRDSHRTRRAPAAATHVDNATVAFPDLPVPQEAPTEPEPALRTDADPPTGDTTAAPAANESPHAFLSDFHHAETRTRQLTAPPQPPTESQGQSP